MRIPSSARQSARSGSPPSRRRSELSRTSSQVRSKQGGWFSRRRGISNPRPATNRRVAASRWRRHSSHETPRNPTLTTRQREQLQRDLRARDTSDRLVLVNQIQHRPDRATMPLFPNPPALRGTHGCGELPRNPSAPPARRRARALRRQPGIRKAVERP